MIMKTQTPGLVVKIAQDEDISHLANFMRGADVREIWASHMHTPDSALKTGLVESTMAFTAHLKDKPVAMFGVLEEDEKTAVIWMLASFEIDTIKLGFARTAKLMINKFHQVYEVLYNYVDIHNYESISWLKRCGAEFDAPIPYGPFGQPFRKFTLRSK